MKRIVGARRVKGPTQNIREKPAFRGFGVVCDKHGRPKFDGDPEKAHPGVKMLLTRAQRKSIGMWDGDWVLDAEGLKRITVISNNEARCEDRLRAAGDLSIDGKIIGRLDPRIDREPGQTFQWRT